MTFVPEALKPELLVRLLQLISDPLAQGATSPWMQRYLIAMTRGASRRDNNQIGERIRAYRKADVFLFFQYIKQHDAVTYGYSIIGPLVSKTNTWNPKQTHTRKHLNRTRTL
jgi:hypothetical protein